MNMHFFWSGIYHGLLILAAILLTLRAIAEADVKDKEMNQKSNNISM